MSVINELNDLKKIRKDFRKEFIFKYNGRVKPSGLYFDLVGQNIVVFKDELVAFFMDRNFVFENPKAPSPSGFFDDFSVYINLVVDNDNWATLTGVSVSIHSEKEKLISKNERVDFYY